MRLVLDTNVYIAALVAHGTCHDVFEQSALQHTVIVSGFILDETREKLLEKFHWPKLDVVRAIRLIESRAIRVEPQPLSSPACRDPDDDNVLATALTGQACALFTGDKDLLALDGYEGLRILPPAQFWAFESTAQ